MKKKKSAVSIKHWLGYAAGDCGGVMTFALMGSIATRYYTNVLKVNPYVLATILLIWNIWDAVNDPLMGILMDKVYAKKQNRNGKFRPWILRATPLLAISFIVFWTVPTFFEGTTMLVVLFFTKLLYEGAYTMLNIPMGSLLSAMADDDEQRASLSSARGFGSGLASVAAPAIAPLILAKFGDTAKSFRIISIICASIGFVLCLCHYFFTEEKHVVSSSLDIESLKLKDILLSFKENKPFLALCIHGMCLCTMQYVSNTVGTYMYSDVLGNIGLMSTSTLLSMPFMLLIFVFSPKIAKNIGLIPFIKYSLLASVALYGGLFVLQVITDINVYVYLIWSSVAAGIGQVSTILQWGMVAEAIDYNEYITGKRTEGTIYGTFNLTRRIGQTVGNSLAVLALSWFGYNANVAVQSSSAIFGIKFLCLVAPALFLLGSWAAFQFIWNITPETQAKIKQYKEEKYNTEEA